MRGLTRFYKPCHSIRNHFLSQTWPVYIGLRMCQVIDHEKHRIDLRSNLQSTWAILQHIIKM